MKNMKLRRMLLETDPPGVKSTQVVGVIAYQNPLMNVAINAGCFFHLEIVSSVTDSSWAISLPDLPCATN